MKKQKTILASIALGIFLLATVSPTFADTKDTSVDRTKITIKQKRKQQ